MNDVNVGDVVVFAWSAGAPVMTVVRMDDKEVYLTFMNDGKTKRVMHPRSRVCDLVRKEQHGRTNE